MEQVQFILTSILCWLGHLKDVKKRRKNDVGNLYENVMKGILDNDLYKTMEKNTLKGNMKGEKKKLFSEHIKDKYFNNKPR